MRQNSAEWLEWRRKHVGASDQIHLNWSAPWSIGWGALWDIKMGKAPEQFQNKQMERGLKLEDEARLAYSFYKEEEFLPALAEHKDFPYLSASLDARSESGLIAEIKCPGKEDHELALRGEVPKKYIPQLCHQLFVTGNNSMDYVSFDGQKIMVVPFHPSSRLIDSVMSRAEEFWSFVRKNQRPDGEWPLPEFDTRIPVVEDKEAIGEAQWNFELREKISELEILLEQSNQKLLSLCDLPRAKIWKLTITTTQRAGAIDYSKVDLLKDVDLEQYRKPPIVTRSIRRS